MKISLRIFRFSRKVLIILCGVLLLGGVAGATAVYIGKDQLLGPPEEDHSGLECKNVQLLKDQRDHQVWLRKYIKTEAADGVTRVKTALRVAAALYEKDKPDLVQVVVLAENGPDKRSDINGHAVGADVIYVPHPENLLDIGKVPALQVSYVDAMPNEAGEFYGTKMKMPEEEASHILASLPEKKDCADPDAELRAAAAAASEGGEGKKAEGEGASAEGGGEGEKAKPAEGGEGEAAAPEGEKPAAEGEAPAEGEKAAEEAAKPEADKGWFASVKSMVFGEEKAEPAPEGESKAEGAKADAPAAGAEGGEAAPAEEPAPEAKSGEAPAPEGGEGAKPAAAPSHG